MNLGPLSKPEWEVCPKCGESFMVRTAHLCPPRYTVWLKDTGFGTKKETQEDIYTHAGPQQAAFEYIVRWDDKNDFSMAKRGAFVKVCVEHPGMGIVDIIEVYGGMEPTYESRRIGQEKVAIDK